MIFSFFLLLLPLLRLVNCSRWDEVTDSIRFHAGLAEAVGVSTEFRLLNGAPPLVLGRGTDDGTAYKTLLEYLERSPGSNSFYSSLFFLLFLLKFNFFSLIILGGGTPLCRHVTEVIDQIKALENVLRANAQKAVVIIITDGEASDGDVMQALRPLQVIIFNPLFYLISCFFYLSS